MAQLILALVAMGIFIAYNAVMIRLFGVPASLSNTFYYLNEKWHCGWVFTIMMIVVSGLLIEPWIYATDHVSSWSHWLGFLPFLTCSCLMFVAVAPNFRTDKAIEAVHMWCARLAAVFAVLWICIVCWRIAYILPVCIGICWLIAWLTKTMKTGRDWWWEMCAFVPTFICIIVELILALNK